MIIGIGTDIVKIDRIERIFKNYGDKFVSRILHVNEIDVFAKLPDKLNTNYLAKRFAGKEAFAKAIGTGISGALSFTDIAILNNDDGRPVLSTNIKKYLDYKIHISLSDDYPLAIAFVIVSI